MKRDPKGRMVVKALSDFVSVLLGVWDEFRRGPLHRSGSNKRLRNSFLTQAKLLLGDPARRGRNRVFIGGW